MAPLIFLLSLGRQEHSSLWTGHQLHLRNLPNKLGSRKVRQEIHKGA